MDYSPPGSSVHGILQARVLEWAAIFLLQGIFPTQGSNPGLLHSRQILYPLSLLGSPSLTGKGSLMQNADTQCTLVGREEGQRVEKVFNFYLALKYDFLFHQNKAWGI